MTIVKFTNPPLIEVVLGIKLEDTKFSSVHFGIYWQAIRERFSEVVDREPIFDTSEDDNLMLPPLRRVMFISPETKELIQIQDNFFCYNWRYKNQEEYPHFENIFKRFLSEWNFFQEWCSSIGKTPLKLSHYELTYLNLIDKDSGWTNTEDHQKIFTFTGGNWNNFLKIPELQDVRLAFTLPDSEDILSVEVDQRNSEADDSDIVLFRLTVDSFDASKDLTNWFQDAHDYIVKSFLVLTKEDIQQEKWGRYET